MMLLCSKIQETILITIDIVEFELRRGSVFCLGKPIKHLFMGLF